MTTTTCTYHCGACGRHFHSLEAFDLHRQGDYAEPMNTPEGRHCVSPLDLDGRLVALTEAGECRMYEKTSDTGVTVWTTARGMEHAKKAPWRF